MFDLAEIRRLLDAFERSDWDELHLVTGGAEIHVASGNVTWTPAPVAAAVAAPAVAPAAPAAATAAAPAAAAAGDGGRSATAPAAPAAADVQLDGAHAVVSPSPGIFWRAPAPGEPPFVDVGQTVTPQTPIGIVEVMKLMNQVMAGVSGTVRAILVENGARVDRDEPMVLIEPTS